MPSLARDAHQLLPEVDVVERERRQLLAAQAGVDQRANHGGVAALLEGPIPKKAAQLILGEQAGSLAPCGQCLPSLAAAIVDANSGKVSHFFALLS